MGNWQKKVFPRPSVLQEPGRNKGTLCHDHNELQYFFVPAAFNAGQTPRTATDQGSPHCFRLTAKRRVR
jgi:hypothetical protein